MKKLLLLTYLAIFGFGVFAQQPLQQYFDGADTDPYYSVIIQLDTSSSNVWQVGTPQKQIFNTAATQPNVLVTDTLNSYPPNAHSSFQFTVVQPIFLWGVTALQWKQKLDMDAGTDGALIEFSADAGASWENAFTSPLVYNFYGFDSANVDTLQNGMVGFTATDTTWRDIWLCFDLSWIAWHDSIMVRYTFVSDSFDTNKEGWMIDNLLVHRTIIHTAVEEEVQTQYLKAYPNPANDILHIEAQKMQQFHLIEHMELIDANGRVVDRWNYLPTKFFIRTSNYSNGLYLLKITTNLKTETLPIVISHK